MNKKILIGTILVLTLLLLMPSIPAIQQKTIEDKAHNDLAELLEDSIKHVEQKQRLLSSIKSYLSNLEGFSEYDKIDEFLKSIENKDLNNIYDSEKIQKFINSETFKHLTSSDSGQTLLNNNYDFDSKIDLFSILINIVLFIVGLITWIPAIISSIFIAIPMILFYTLYTGWDVFQSWSSDPTIFLLIISFITGFVYGISNWLTLFIPAILWPFYLVYLFQ